MTSVRKRKMARSSVRKNTRRLKDQQRKVSIRSNAIIAANWDSSLTLQQNYKKLGLRAKLGSFAGGQEKKVETLTEIRLRKQQEEANKKIDIEDIENTEDPAKIPKGEARLIRDPETQEVTKIIYGTMEIGPVNEKDSETEVIKQLRQLGQENSLHKKGRKVSEREGVWLKELHEKYGDDYDKMKWDKKLNIYQFSAGELKKRMTKWKSENGI